MRVRRFFLYLCLATGASAVAASADTIVLKNGRRISVIEARENGEDVTGETSDGEITLPKSLVEKIERGSVPSPSRTASGLNFAPSGTTSNNPADGIGDITRLDAQHIAALDVAAMNGNAEAALKASAAHNAAAVSADRQGDLAKAIAEEEKARRFAPGQPNILLNLAYFHLRQSEYSTALDLIHLVRKAYSDSADAARLAGWADYGLNRISDAVAEWKRAQELQPSPEVAKALERAQRDAQTESEFREGLSNHFIVKYSGTAEPGLARNIVNTLEIHYSDICDALNFTPAEPIGVILYTNQQFADITRAPGWAGAINDGRIRLPVQGVTVVNDQLSRILKHELTHSFIQQKTRGRCPTWLNEGIAQWMEGIRSKPYARALAAEFDAGHVSPLRDLEATWMNLSESTAGIAYAWSEAVVEEIVADGGTIDLNRILDALQNSPSGESALRTALHLDYPVLQQETADYLRGEVSYD